MYYCLKEFLLVSSYTLQNISLSQYINIGKYLIKSNCVEKDLNYCVDFDLC